MGRKASAPVGAWDELLWRKGVRSTPDGEAKCTYAIGYNGVEFRIQKVQGYRYLCYVIQQTDEWGTVEAKNRPFLLKVAGKVEQRTAELLMTAAEQWDRSLRIYDMVEETIGEVTIQEQEE